MGLGLGLNGKEKENKQKAGEKGMSMIDSEWEKHDESIPWLLEELIPQMDKAAKEIANLMKDSFQRYKIKYGTGRR